MIICSWNGFPITQQEIQFLLDFTKNQLILFLVPLIFQSMRKIKKFVLKEKGYESICEIIMICLTESLRQFNTDVPKELLKISNSYHIKKEDKKIYLLEIVKKHSIWQDFKFWECCLLENIAISRKNYSYSDKAKDFEAEIVNDNYREIISNNICSLALQILDLTEKNEIPKRFVEIFFEKYKLGEKRLQKVYKILDEYKNWS